MDDPTVGADLQDVGKTRVRASPSFGRCRAGRSDGPYDPCVHLLVVEDEDAIAEPLVEGLKREGFDVTRVATGAAALEAAPADLVLLDLRLPDTDGYAVCRELRARSDVPIIMVTAKGEEVDRVVGLELGADDYVVKPFGLRELVARIRAVSRRTAGRTPSSGTLRAGPIEIDVRARRATVSGRELALTVKEFDLLALLVREAGGVVDRKTIMRDVWDTTWLGSSKTVDVHVASLRKKLGDPSLVETVRGVGLRVRA
jgi:two-component system response regulator RegX3